MAGFSEAWEALGTGGREALRQAHIALRAGGLPCGSALVDGDGWVVAEGRNRAYDPPTGEDHLEATPLAHAELNVLARVATERDMGQDTLWSTQQPCAMCAQALEFCGVGSIRYLAADPAFVGIDDAGAGVVLDPTGGDVDSHGWAVGANVMFLQPFIRLGYTGRVEKNRRAEPETTELALALFASGELTESLEVEEALAETWDRIGLAAERRWERLGG